VVPGSYELNFALVFPPVVCAPVNVSCANLGVVEVPIGNQLTEVEVLIHLSKLPIIYDEEVGVDGLNVPNVLVETPKVNVLEPISKRPDVNVNVPEIEPEPVPVIILDDIVIGVPLELFTVKLVMFAVGLDVRFLHTPEPVMA